MANERDATPAVAPPRRDAVGGSLLLVAALLWSLNGLFIRPLNSAGLSGWAIAGYRSLFSCLFLTPWVIRRWQPIQGWGWIAGAVLCFSAMCATFVNAMTQTTVANAIVLQYTAPGWVFLMSPWITGERATRRQVTSLVFALSGVAIIFACQFNSDAAGLALGLSSGVVFGMQTVFFRKARAVDPMVLTWLACGGSAVLLLAVAYATKAPVMTLSLAGWLALMGLVQFAAPYVLYSAGLRRMSAQKGVLFILLEPVLSPVWVWLALGEIPLTSTLVGGGCICASVIYLALIDLRRAGRYAR